jgi:hypothetical protein
VNKTVTFTGKELIASKTVLDNKPVEQVRVHVYNKYVGSIISQDDKRDLEKKGQIFVSISETTYGNMFEIIQTLGDIDSET